MGKQTEEGYFSTEEKQIRPLLLSFKKCISVSAILTFSYLHCGKG